MNPILEIKGLIPFLAGILLLVLIANILGYMFQSGRKKKPYDYTYDRKEYFMSGPEREFFRMLVAGLGDSYCVFAQVHLPTLLDHHIHGQKWRPAFAHISQKSVDFVICDRELRSLLAIELDDRSHNRPVRRERDREVERMLAEADFPLLRIPDTRSHDTESLARLVQEKLTPPSSILKS